MDSKRLRADFIKLFGTTARYRHRYEVFRDFIEMAALAVHNGLFKDDQVEQRYLQLIQRYEKPDQERFPQLLGLLVMMLEATPEDVLGSIFMELELGSSRAGQFFTPYHVSLLMAKLSTGGSREEVLGNRPFLTVQEPACGAGGMVIALAQHLREIGVNPQTEMWVHCTDIDPVPALMCYLQLALLHIPAMVVVGCTLRQTVTAIYRTPAHFLGLWESRIHRHFASQERAEPVVEVTPAPAAQSLILPSQRQLAGNQSDMFATG